MPSVDEIKDEIRMAFAGVKLDGAISLEQARVLDGYATGSSVKEFGAFANSEIADDWSKISPFDLDEFEEPAHLDPKGYRYYIPALMLRLLDKYDPGSMMTISTLASLYPKTESREHNYSELTKPQRQAIARYMQALPTLVDLCGEDKTVVERAYRNYWSRYIE